MEKKSLNEKYPDLANVLKGEAAVWINPYYTPFNTVKAVSDLVADDAAIADAAQRLQKFAPFIERVFPETAADRGLIESPLEAADNLQRALAAAYECRIPGRLFLKLDSELAVAGSIKARGGIYEILKYAESLALKQGLLSMEESYAKFAAPEMRQFFSKYTIQAGSTGNLGMSIGIISAALGFKTIIHMSADARQWKKDLLRAKGVTVIEYENDYSAAVAAGRQNSAADPASYFVDDEKSKELFLGYAVAGQRLARQLDEKQISVAKDRPLFVYLPTGVGGAPGGVAYGLKRIFKDNVHCFFAEPVQCPSVLIGIASQLFEKADVRDFGLSGKTAADGLACASPSSFAARLMTNFLSGEFTVSDKALYDYLRLLYKSEGRQIEPSACAGFCGAVNLLNPAMRAYCAAHGITDKKLANCTQIVWTTGGALVPDKIRAEYLKAML